MMFCKHSQEHLASLLCTVNPEYVMTLGKDGSMFLNGKKIDDTEAATLKSEAIALKNFKLWNIMQETLHDQAIKVMCEKSTNWEDMRGGKLMLHNLEVIKTIVETANKFGENKI